MVRSLIVGAALAWSSPAHAAAIPINNPGFETPDSGNPNDWGIGATDLADVSIDVAHGGTQSLKFTAGAGQNTDAFNPVVGIASGAAGSAVTLSTYFYTPSSAPLSGVLLALQIEFKQTLPGGGDATVGNGELVFVPEQITADAWTQLSYTGTSPAAWDVLILHVRTIGTADASGVVYADDVSAVVPEPTTLAGLTAGGAALLGRRRRRASR